MENEKVLGNYSTKIQADFLSFSEPRTQSQNRMKRQSQNHGVARGWLAPAVPRQPYPSSQACPTWGKLKTIGCSQVRWSFERVCRRVWATGSGVRDKGNATNETI